MIQYFLLLFDSKFYPLPITMIHISSRQIGEPEPQVGPVGPSQIIGARCPKDQAYLNGHCRDIPDVGLTKCGVVNIDFNDYMIYTDPTRIIGGEAADRNRWPWQVSITKNKGEIPGPITGSGSNGCDIFLSFSKQMQIFYPL